MKQKKSKKYFEKNQIEKYYDIEKRKEKYMQRLMSI